MNIYISGISGTGMGPLALMAKAAGHTVNGSDLAKGAIYQELIDAGIEVSIGKQDGEFLRKKIESGVDWFVHTSALPANHPELIIAHEAGIKCTKRDDFTAFLVEQLNLKMIAVAGTHGKTTTTAMIVWGALQAKLPVSYIVGTTLGFAPSGAYHEGDKYFVYEADEYDRNFLKYHPWLAVIPAVSYDHPDIYPTEANYKEAFEQFKKQSRYILESSEAGLKGSDGNTLSIKPDMFVLAGSARRIDAALATTAIMRMIYQEAEDKGMILNFTPQPIIEDMNRFPGVGRRFEKLIDGLYTDYAHHPDEIKATIDVAKDECKICGKQGIVAIYQPHQNVRQHEVKDEYREVFAGADKVLWLPTYLTREDSSLRIIEPEEFIAGLSNRDNAEKTDLDDELAEKIKKYLADNYLVVLMAAGPADDWLRNEFGAC